METTPIKVGVKGFFILDEDQYLSKGLGFIRFEKTVYDEKEISQINLSHKMDHKEKYNDYSLLVDDHEIKKKRNIYINIRNTKDNISRKLF